MFKNPFRQAGAKLNPPEEITLFKKPTNSKVATFTKNCLKNRPRCFNIKHWWSRFSFYKLTGERRTNINLNVKYDREF